ncbi:MAG: hypothetical protein Q8R28_10205 [Dehalococcoidia bacterium]|nr:hypothetical protein [Dehalococcoidia bacterium]
MSISRTKITEALGQARSYITEALDQEEKDTPRLPEGGTIPWSLKARPELKRAFVELAKGKGMSTSRLVRQAMYDFLKKADAPGPEGG